MNRRGTAWPAWIALLSACLCLQAAAAEIPGHPDRLRFPKDPYQPPRVADYRVVLPRSQVPAYLAESHELPLVKVQVFVRAGSYLVQPGQEGLHTLLEYLMAHGGTEPPTDYSPDELEAELAFLGAELHVSIGETSSMLSLELLSGDLDQGLVILRGILSNPRIDAAAMNHGKSLLRKRMGERNDSAADIEAREREVLAFGEDHFTTRFMTAASVAALGLPEIRAFHQRWFHPRNFVITASGDFKRDKMIARLDQMVEQWPFPGAKDSMPVPRPHKRATPGVYLIDKQGVTQGRVSLMLPGIEQDDPEYFTAQVLNEVLGGGGRSSRVPARLRTSEGLAYQAASRFRGGVYYPDVLLLQFQSRLPTCSYATSVMLEEMARLRDHGLTPRELAVAKSHLVETLPQRFRSGALTVSALAQEEITGRYVREPDYYQHYRERIEKVTTQQVEGAAKKWLDLQKALILVVGSKAELLAPDPRHPLTFDQLGYGPPRVLPPRDPMTMKR